MLLVTVVGALLVGGTSPALAFTVGSVQTVAGTTILGGIACASSSTCYAVAQNSHETSGVVVPVFSTDLQVALSLTPSTATAGTKVTASGSVTNTGPASEAVTLRLSVASGATTVFTSPSVSVTLGAGQTISQSFVFPVSQAVPPGVYTVTLTATDSTGSASAQATLTVT